MCFQMDDEVKKGIVIGVFGGLFAGAGISLISYVREMFLTWRDKKRIYTYFTSDEIESRFGNLRWISTRKISRHTNLTQERVNYICSIHKKIIPSLGPKED